MDDALSEKLTRVAHKALLMAKLCRANRFATTSSGCCIQICHCTPHQALGLLLSCIVGVLPCIMGVPLCIVGVLVELTRPGRLLFAIAS